MTDYNRRGRRTPTKEMGKIKLGLFKKVECEIKDVSPGGARLILPSDTKLPEKFSLKLPQFKRARDCVRRWESGDMVGVEFDL